jgi:MYXO-CTERM domain-containing protein
LKKNVGFPQPTFNFAPTAVVRDDFSTDATAYIQVVPEPTSVVLGLFAAAGLGAVVIRRRRARKAA